ncbi:hypothetical protein HAX54_039971, partial [Datura stramonium]|nr:hypothetical protein [Datura stramonium]
MRWQHATSTQRHARKRVMLAGVHMALAASVPAHWLCSMSHQLRIQHCAMSVGALPRPNS